LTVHGHFVLPVVQQHEIFEKLIGPFQHDVGGRLKRLERLELHFLTDSSAPFFEPGFDEFLDLHFKPVP
jgi:hypothetical protein